MTDFCPVCNDPLESSQERYIGLCDRCERVHWRAPGTLTGFAWTVPPRTWVLVSGD